MSLDVNQRHRIRAELVEYIAGNVRSISIEQNTDVGEVIRVLVEELSPHPESFSPRICTDITNRALQTTPHPPEKPATAPPRKSRRWLIPPFRGGSR